MTTSLSDGETSDLSSYISESSSDEFDTDWNASNDAKSNLAFDYVPQSNSGRNRSTDDAAFSFTTMKIESQM